MQNVMNNAGFTDIQITEEAAEFLYANEEEWLTAQFARVNRSQWEAVEPAIREQWKAELMEGLRAMKQANGIPRMMRVLYTTGVKPQS
jgi:hypothetical protein